jgi:hypothetical protein
MKTKKSIILFLLLVPIAELFYSCGPCDDITTKHISYSHKTIFLKNLDNSGAQAVETDSLQLNKNVYGIRLYLTKEKNTVAHTKPINSIFTQSAYAFHRECPPEYIFSPSDSIKSIKIFTLNTFDNQHAKNSDITSYFRIAHSYSKIEDYVKNMAFTYEYNSDFETFPEKDVMRIDLLLMTAPKTSNNQQFKIQVVLSDGRILEEQTPEIQLL